MVLSSLEFEFVMASLWLLCDSAIYAPCFGYMDRKECRVFEEGFEVYDSWEKLFYLSSFRIFVMPGHCLMLSLKFSIYGREFLCQVSFRVPSFTISKDRKGLDFL